MKKTLSRLNGLNKMRELRISTVAGAWVFYFLSALLPLLFLFVTAFAVFGVNVTHEIAGSLPAEFREAAYTLLETAENASQGVTLFFTATVFLSCSALLNQMRKDGEYIYGEKSAKSGFAREIGAVLAIGTLFAVFLGAALLFAFHRLLFSTVFSGARSAWVKTGAFTAIITACFFVNALLNKFISPVKLSFGQACSGSAVSVAVIVAGTIGFTLYLRLFNPYGSFYGSLTAVVVFLFWTYILMLGLVLGVITAKRAYFKRIEEKTAEKRAKKPVGLARA